MPGKNVWRVLHCFTYIIIYCMAQHRDIRVSDSIFLNLVNVYEINSKIICIIEITID